VKLGDMVKLALEAAKLNLARSRAGVNSGCYSLIHLSIKLQ